MLLGYLNASDWLMYVCAGGIVFCWFIEIVAAFRNNATGLGIFSLLLSPVAGLMIGCVHARQWRIVQVMIVFIGSIIGLFATLLYRMYSVAETLS
jgi:uncharacterized membrane protein